MLAELYAAGPTRRAIRVALALATAAAMAPGLAGADVRFRPGVQIASTYVDNAGLAEDGAPERSQWLLDFQPTINLEVDTQRFDALLDYSVRRIESMSNGDYSQTYHRLSSGADLQLLEDLLSLHADAAYTQTLQDPTRVINFQQLFDVGNVVDQLVVGGGPRLHKEFSSTVLEASYDIRKVDYKGSGISIGTTEDSTNTLGAIAFGSAPESRHVLGWRVSGETHEVDYEFTERYRYDVATLDVDFALGRRGFFLVAQGGRESDVAEDSTAGGLNASRWNAGIRWAPSRNDRIELRTGRRFSGTMYEGSITHVARLLTLRATYLETPTTEMESSGRAATVNPGTEPPPVLQDPLSGLRRPTSEVFLNKELRAEAQLTGAYTSITINGYRQKREYLALERADTGYGGGVDVTRRLGPRTSLSLRTALEKLQAREGTDFRYWTAAIELTRRLGRAMELSFELLHIDQDQGLLNQVRANAATVRFGMEF
jgi:hypothetical protein